jgi:hypothetical protein
MALGFVQQNQNSSSGSVSTLSVTLPSVAANSLVKVFVKYEGLTTTTSVSDGTNTFTPRSEKAHANNDVRGRWFYLLSSGGSGGTMTFQVTFGSARPWVAIHVLNFSYTGGSTASFDTEPVGSGSSGTGTAATSGVMTTTGTDEVVVAGLCNYTGNGSSSPLVNGVAADGSQTDSIQSMSWYKLLTATFAGGAATLTVATGDWVVVADAIKVTAGGGGGGATVTPGVGALAAAGFAPVVLTPRVVQPGVGDVVVTGYPPTIPAPMVVRPGVGLLIATGFAITAISQGIGAIHGIKLTLIPDKGQLLLIPRKGQLLLLPDKSALTLVPDR